MRMGVVRRTLLPLAACARPNWEVGNGDDEIPTLSTEKTMTVAIYICSAALLGGLAIGVYNLESWLERWDYKRHLED
jgi:hypothetical protein